MKNLKVIIAYRGTNYHGFQRQNNAYTVQEAVETAVSRVLNTPTEIFGCSRTDAGVHANNYCFSVIIEKDIPVRNFFRGVNRYLPDDISILSCEEVPLDFHARYSCKGKQYIYKIHNSESRNPFAADLMYHYRRPMDIELIRNAASHFIGTHDFKSFCSVDNEKENTVRTIYRFDIKKIGETVNIYIKGDGFLYNMIRIMVGTLLWVNEGKLEASQIPEILASKDRRFAGKTADAHGLYLDEIYYDDTIRSIENGG